MPNFIRKPLILITHCNYMALYDYMFFIRIEKWVGMFVLCTHIFLSSSLLFLLVVLPNVLEEEDIILPSVIVLAFTKVRP